MVPTPRVGRQRDGAGVILGGISGCFGVFQEIVCYGFDMMCVCFMCVTILFVLSMGHLLFDLWDLGVLI